MKFANDTMLAGSVNTEEGLDIIQQELDHLENWCNRSGMKFNSTKCQVIHLETNNKNFCSKLGVNQLGMTMKGKDLGVLVEHRMLLSPITCL